MKFVIHIDEFADVVTASWVLQTNDGMGVCRNVDDFPSEQDARSDIARAKTTMKGARFAKVEVES